MKNGNRIKYTWSEQEVTGYMQTSTETIGNVTVMINSMHRPLKPPTGTVPPQRGEPEEVIEDYDTPLGVETIINHVGDCFD